MTDLFEKYGDKTLRWLLDESIFSSPIYDITLNELKEALNKELYQSFKERYDREKKEEEIICCERRFDMVNHEGD